MNKLPYPDKILETNDEIREYIEALTFNAMAWLKVDGYIFYVFLHGEEDFESHEGAGLSIQIEFPYKKFRLHVQEDSIKKMRGVKNEGPIWKNIEQSVFHEIFHVLTDNLCELATKRYTTPTAITEANEFLVDHLTHCFYPEVEKSRNKNTEIIFPPNPYSAPVLSEPKLDVADPLKP